MNNLLWAVEGDPEDHGDGELVAVYAPRNIYIENKLIIVAPGDDAVVDDAGHEDMVTKPLGASTNVIAYGNRAGGSA